jgi:hypothetical protein
MKNILIVALLISGSIWSEITISTAVANPIVSKSWKKLDKDKYSIRYPDNWQVEEKDDSTATGNLTYPVAIVSPLESPQDKFRENVNLVIENIEGQTLKGASSKAITLDSYLEAGTALLKKSMKNYRTVESKKITNGRLPYHKLIYTWTYDSFNLQVEQYCWLIDGKAYILVFTSERDKFPKFKNTGEQILKSFTPKA